VYAEVASGRAQSSYSAPNAPTSLADDGNQFSPMLAQNPAVVLAARQAVDKEAKNFRTELKALRQELHTCIGGLEKVFVERIDRVATSANDNFDKIRKAHESIRKRTSDLDNEEARASRVVEETWTSHMESQEREAALMKERIAASTSWAASEPLIDSAPVPMSPQAVDVHLGVAAPLLQHVDSGGGGAASSAEMLLRLSQLEHSVSECLALSKETSDGTSDTKLHALASTALDAQLQRITQLEEANVAHQGFKSEFERKIGDLLSGGITSFEARIQGVEDKLAQQAKVSKEESVNLAAWGQRLEALEKTCKQIWGDLHEQVHGPSAAAGSGPVNQPASQPHGSRTRPATKK